MPAAKKIIPLVVLGMAGLLLIAGVFWYAGYIGTDHRKNQPDASPVAAVSGQVQGAKTVKYGYIKGKVSFPGETVPSMLVCAVKPEATAPSRCVEVERGRAGYKINLKPGTYYIHAHLKAKNGTYTPRYKAYYTEYVACQRTAQTCADDLHAKYVAVTVEASKTTDNADPTDWETAGQ